nr:hypothetical protein [Tanacetum cinerariifolium]
MVLRVERKLFVIEQHVSHALPTDSKYLRSGMRFMMLMISDFAGFVRKYNKHNMGKTVGELHALLIEYEKESAARILNMVLSKKDTSDKLQQRSVKCIFIGYPKQTMGYYFYFPSENKIVVARYAEFLEKNIISQEVLGCEALVKIVVARYAEFLEKNIISQEVSGRVVELEEIQDEDTSPSENTSEIPMEVEGDEPPQEEVIPVRRAIRILITIAAFYDYEI